MDSSTFGPLADNRRNLFVCLDRAHWLCNLILVEGSDAALLKQCGALQQRLCDALHGTPPDRLATVHRFLAVFRSAASSGGNRGGPDRADLLPLGQLPQKFWARIRSPATQAALRDIRGKLQDEL